MIPYAGWELPVQYRAGPIQEHLAVRSAGGLFDVSHMARIRVTGRDATLFLQRILTRDVARAKLGTCIYSLLAYEDGTTVDDVIVIRLEDQWMVVANAANRTKDLDWFAAHSYGLEVFVEDETEQSAMLACQGPASNRILSKMLAVDLDKLRRFRVIQDEFRGIPIQVSRTGYTGEKGYEVMLPAHLAPEFFQILVEYGEPEGMQVCGLAARDSLRLEAAYPLYGQEISSSISPLEANLAWAISMQKGDFIGRSALLKQILEAAHRKQIGFMMVDKGVPRSGYLVLVGEERIGYVTSGNRSPSLNEFIGLALVSGAVHTEDIEIEIRGQRKGARIVNLPFYQSARP